MTRTDDQLAYFKLLTYWKNHASIENFTGPYPEKAVGYDDDKAFLLDFPGSVDHFEVFAE
ncbi:MAG: hypothetical protein AAGC88_08650 [Bacteroidota bacterium]